MPERPCVLCAGETRAGDHVCPRCLEAILAEQKIDVMNINQPQPKEKKRNA